MVQLSLSTPASNDLLLTPYGSPATAALAGAIRRAKGDDALAPVTVAVPSNYAGLSLRRKFASSEGGLVNVRFLVLARVAELLGAPLLAQQERRPLTSSLRGEAVRAVLEADPGIFGDAATHSATERSIESTFRDLRQAPDRALDALAGRSERAAHVVRLFRAFRKQTSGYYDEEELFVAAVNAMAADTAALRDVGHVILYLPRRLTREEAAMLRALGQRGTLTTIIGLTGDDQTDALAHDLAAQIDAGSMTKDSTADVPHGTQIVAATDAEEEVRSVLRLVMERLASGTPLHRIAVLYPNAEPYAMLAREQFAAARVPHNGRAVRTLAQTLSGRTLLGLLRLRERSFKRDAVMDWLSSAPILEQARGHPAPAHRWDALARKAGVVGGAEQWAQRLTRHRLSLEAQRDALESARGEDEGNVARLRRVEADLDQTQRLASFIEELITQTRPGGRASWTEFAAWGRDLLARYLGGEGHRSDWPDDEIEAHRAVEAALDALVDLADVRATTTESTFRRALERELEGPAKRTGRFGEGVLLGRVADALGTDFDVVYVIGMSEGLLPPRSREDPLLPDDERSSANEVPLRANRQEEARRDYLAALACAQERVLVFPRADLRGQRGKLPARWLLETASHLEGSRLFSDDLETLVRPWYRPVPSFEGALKNGLEPSSSQEYDLRTLLRWRDAGKPAREHYLGEDAPTLRTGLLAEESRSAAEISRWDGYVEAQPDLRPSRDRPASPTALQNWASCPRRYFLGHVLYVSETEEPEDSLSITPLERGNLVHGVLEDFITQAPKRSTPDQPWSDDERALLLRIGAEHCDRFEGAGRTGRRLLWRLDRERILGDLRGFLDADEQLRAKYGVVPEEPELFFGRKDRDPVVVELPDGSAVAFRGRIDRVDRAPDGSSLLVLDYKTGSPTMYRKLGEREPVLGGRYLQLPIYALAAQKEYGALTTHAYYWFVREQFNFDTHGYVVEEPQLDAFRNTLAAIADGIEGGVFPAHPGRPIRGTFGNCVICPYDRVCPVDRARVWERKSRSPELQDYARLTEEQE